jgi:hypothetical protein
MKYIFFLILIIISTQGYAQSLLDWKAYTSYRSVIAIEEDSNNRYWVSTEGGVAIYEDSVLLNTLTVIDGLSRLGGTSLEYDPFTNNVFVGYIDGMIDIIDIDNFNVTKLEDISRNTVFTSKSVNSLLVNGESLFVGTDFGIVEYDLNLFLVTNSYLKLGDFDTGVGVNDLEIIDGQIFAATGQGIAYSDLDGNYEEANWNNYDENEGLDPGSIETIGVFNSEMMASSVSQNYLFQNSMWLETNMFTSSVIFDYINKASKSVAIADRNIYIEENSNIYRQILSDRIATSVNVFDSGRIIFGTLNNGIGLVSNSNTDSEYLTPSGPYQNFFQGINFDNGTLVSSSSQKSSQNGNIDKGKGFYIFDGVNWNNVNAYNTPELDNATYRRSFTSLVTKDYYYFGSWGEGIARYNKGTGEVVVFNETNSTIRGWDGGRSTLNYPVMIGIEEDINGDVWTVSRFAETPLYRQTPGDMDWQAFDESNAITSADLYEGLFIDSYDLKWIPLQNNQTSGTGLLVLDTNNPEDESDDIGIKLQEGSNNGNLPDNKVKAIIEDKNGEVWIGTERGIAKFIFPELIIEGSSQERTAQWLINEDTSAVSRFLLRDINVSTMAVNAANEKWIGSTNQGIWVLNAEGSRIIKRFTAENSSLFSNNIISIAINDVTGEVFIATDVGLIGYQDVPQKPVKKMKDLKVFPNPFNYDKDGQIFIEGLADEATIRVLGVDGTVVNTFETKGGRVSWDAKHANGSELGSGVYFIVAIDSEGNSKGIGKIIIVK